MEKLHKELKEFKEREGIGHKGPLCVALHVTRFAIENGLPIDSAKMLTDRGGQVRGLGKGRIQSILQEHGIERVLAEEGGRTSRGSIEIMTKYVTLLNRLNQEGIGDLEKIEEWWIEQVRLFFASTPFKLRLDPSKSFKAIIRDLIDQADKRQSEGRGAMIVGTVMQHLVGAKLEAFVNPDQLEHHGASVADASTGRAGDYIVDDVVIHVTAAPNESLIRKCADNIDSSLKPVVVTISKKIVVAEELGIQAGIKDRIDIFEIEQFMAANIYELSQFSKEKRVVTVKEIVQRYNTIVKKHESDPGLKIEVT